MISLVSSLRTCLDEFLFLLPILRFLIEVFVGIFFLNSTVRTSSMSLQLACLAVEAMNAIPSSLTTNNPLHDSYHSNSLTTDSGVDCSDIPIRNFQNSDDDDDDDENEMLSGKYNVADIEFHHETGI